MTVGPIDNIEYDSKMDASDSTNSDSVNRRSINDENTIFLSNLGPCTEKQVQNFLETYIQRYFSVTGRRVWGKWKINLVTNRQNEPVGIAYVYFSNTQMYHIFIGNNPEGTRRFGKVPNPHFLDFSEKEENILEDIDLRTPEFINIPYENPVQIPYIILDENQVIKYNCNKLVKPKIDPCILKLIDSDLDKNTLVCSKAPSNISKQCIKNIFEFYVKKSKDLEEGYPRIDIESKGNFSTIKICYHPDSIDGKFALIMTKKIKLFLKNKNYILMFGHKKCSL